MDEEGNPKKPWLEMPKEPELANYRKKRINPDTEDLSSSSSTLEDTISGSHAESILDLTPSDLACYQFELEMHQHETNRVYHEHHAIYKLKNYVLETVHPTYRMICCRPEQQIHRWYASLVARLKPSEKEQQRFDREAYKKAVEPLREEPRDWDAWITDWELAMALAKHNKVPDAEDIYEWLEDFFTVIRPYEGKWVNVIRACWAPKISNKTLDYEEVAKFFRWHTKMMMERRKDNQDSDGEDQDKSSTQPRRARKRGRRR
ncbi:hypothetical protein F5B19DRAFT_351079 [Rostrohypoxylon terebratum]|nr:hypothetical protein F5B19DRAFT_351079 [Rostrohypoxylon terebratum]